MNVLHLSRYGRIGASSRVRSFQYLPYLKAYGIETTVAPLFGDDYIEAIYTGKSKNWKEICKAYFRRLACLLNSRHFDLLWIEKEIFPWLPSWVERLLNFLGIPYLIDYDDAIFHNYDLHSNRFVRGLLGKKIDVAMQRATVVTVGNDYLAEHARRAGAKRIEYLPTVIDLEQYRVIPARNKVITIGWIGTPVTAPYLRLVQPGLAEICKNANVRVVLVGSGPIELDGVPLEIRPWSEKTEVSYIQGFDVGIMPLPDKPWERGKCGYKLIQYMACGRPVIASPVGVNQKIVEEGVNGFLATTTEEWIQALKILYVNNKLRESMGMAGRNKVESQYCVQVTAPLLASLLWDCKGWGKCAE